MKINARIYKTVHFLQKKNSISDKKIGTERRETLARVTDLTKTLKTLVPDNWEDGAQQVSYNLTLTIFLQYYIFLGL